MTVAYIFIVIIGLIAYRTIEIIEDTMWELEREKAFGYELTYIDTFHREGSANE